MVLGHGFGPTTARPGESHSLRQLEEMKSLARPLRALASRFSGNSKPFELSIKNAV